MSVATGSSSPFFNYSPKGESSRAAAFTFFVETSWWDIGVHLGSAFLIVLIERSMRCHWKRGGAGGDKKSDDNVI